MPVSIIVSPGGGGIKLVKGSAETITGSSDKTATVTIRYDAAKLDVVGIPSPVPTSTSSGELVWVDHSVSSASTMFEFGLQCKAGETASSSVRIEAVFQFSGTVEGANTTVGCL